MQRDISTNFPSILEELENSSLASARTLANRLRPLLRNNVFECQKTGSTSLPLSPNIHVFDLSGYPAGIRIILAELLLYDWFRSARALQTPIIIMVDEVQNLKLGRGTVLNQIITEGRRFSIGSTLISQSLKAFSPDEQLALSQTGTKLFLSHHSQNFGRVPRCWRPHSTVPKQLNCSKH